MVDADCKQSSLRLHLHGNGLKHMQQDLADSALSIVQMLHAFWSMSITSA